MRIIFLFTKQCKKKNQAPKTLVFVLRRPSTKYSQIIWNTFDSFIAFCLHSKFSIYVFVPNPGPGVSLLPGDFVEVNKQWHMTLLSPHRHTNTPQPTNNVHKKSLTRNMKTKDSPTISPFLFYFYLFIFSSFLHWQFNVMREKTRSQVDVLFKSKSFKCSSKLHTETRTLPQAHANTLAWIE